MTEETLGRRIAAHRKKLGLIQDALADRLGVTAQAVSKWENDQSCPDISMLPKLAAIFDTSIDALLGVEKKQELPEEPKPVEKASAPVYTQRRLGISIALWLLLTGAVLLAPKLFPLFFEVPVWSALSMVGLLVFGMMGVYPRFSLFRLGCGLTGGYYLYCALFHPAVQLNEELILPLLLLYFGAGLLVDSIRGRKAPKGHLSISGAGKNVFEYEGNTFLCSTGFGDDHRVITLPVLEGGEGSVCFGELSVDLQACQAYSNDCSISMKCAFGSLMLYVPRSVRLQCINKTFCGAVQEYGHPDPETAATIRVENDVCFGEISIKYI